MPVTCFVQLIESSIWAFGAEQHAQYKSFLPLKRPIECIKLNSTCLTVYFLYCVLVRSQLRPTAMAISATAVISAVEKAQ